MHTHKHSTAPYVALKGQLWESVLSFFVGGPRDGIHVQCVTLGHRHLYPLSHLKLVLFLLYF